MEEPVTGTPISIISVPIEKVPADPVGVILAVPVTEDTLPTLEVILEPVTEKYKLTLEPAKASSAKATSPKAVSLDSGPGYTVTKLVLEVIADPVGSTVVVDNWVILPTELVVLLPLGRT